MTRLRWISTLVSIGLLWTAAPAAADFSVPPLRSAVTDQAHMLSTPTRERLETALHELQRRGGTQLAVLTLPNLGGLTIEQASIHITDKWQLGTRKADNGVLLLIARDEHRIRIEVGQGLEGVLPDAYAKRIIDESMSPLFREGNIDGGVTVGVYQIAQRTNPDLDLRPYLKEAVGRAPASHRTRSPWQGIFALIVLLLVLTTRMGLLPFLFLGGSGRYRRRGFYGGGGGFGGSSGGGGFSGGGGGFSGGGASGGW